VLKPIREIDLHHQGPVIRRFGSDITLVGVGHSAHLGSQVAHALEADGVSTELIDLRVINPLDCSKVVESASKTGRLLVADGDWSSCGLAAEVIAQVAESRVGLSLKCPPQRLTLPATPAPTSRALEAIYYPTVETIRTAALKLMN